MLLYKMIDKAIALLPPVRKCRRKGSQKLYDNNEAFRREVNLILALAFGEEYLKDSTFAEQIEPILDYFEDSYVGRPYGGKRRKRRFANVKWNVIKLVLSDEPRTSNSIESFNGQLVRTIAASHPTIWKSIEALRNEFAISEQKVSAKWGGEKTPQRGITYRNLDARLKNTISRFEEIPVID
uniref:Transposase n=1 Tax=Ditylenchus dipsaci TaxID=166011 RepID=A0A915DGU5_9BILA